VTPGDFLVFRVFMVCYLLSVFSKKIYRDDTYPVLPNGVGLCGKEIIATLVNIS
jgi:hypothetical protein